MKLRKLAIFPLVMLLATIAVAQDPTVAPLMKLLASGRLPAQRMPQVLEMVCKRGGAEELKFVFEKALQGDALEPKLRAQSLAWLAEAAETRKLKPAGDLDGIEKLVQAEGDKNPELTLAAIKVATIWKVKSVGDELQSLAQNEKTGLRLRKAAIEGLAEIGGREAQETLSTLAKGKSAVSVRMLAAASLAKIDPDQGAAAASEVLAAATSDDDPTAMLTTFFQLKDGAGKLATALKSSKLKPDVAKQSLRTMFAIGSSDTALSDLLSEMAGIAASPTPPTQDEALKIAAEVSAKGNAARGEKIFRRADLSCLNCHSVTRAGGQVGPELSSVGRISPVDYIVTSILNPNLAIKEQFITRIIETSDGKVVTGIAADRDELRVVLKTADGKVVTIPTADIETEEEGKSLMPQGITKFLTQQEFYDLAKFVSELGKDGTYALPSVPTIQRWRVLLEPTAELLAEVPNVEQVREYLLDTSPDLWKSAYAKFSGELPLDEVQKADLPHVMYLMGEVAVTVEGDVKIAIQSTEKVQTWVDATPFENQYEITTQLAEGRHKLVFRVERSESEAPIIKVQLTKPDGSAAQFDVVGGQ